MFSLNRKLLENRLEESLNHSFEKLGKYSPRYEILAMKQKRIEQKYLKERLKLTNDFQIESFETKKTDD